MKIEQVKSVSENRAKDFRKLGITTSSDLVRYYPRAYLDMTNRVSITEVFHNDMALVACRIARLDPPRYNGRVRYVRAWFVQDDVYFSAVWFNMPYVAQRFKEGEYLLYGRVENKYGQIGMVNPSFELLSENHRLKGLVPVYSLRGSLTQRIFRDAVAEALKVERFPTVIPEELIKKYWKEA